MPDPTLSDADLDALALRHAFSPPILALIAEVREWRAKESRHENALKTLVILGHATQDEIDWAEACAEMLEIARRVQSEFTVMPAENGDLVLGAIASKVRPYTEADIAMATKLSKGVVRKVCKALCNAGLIVESWLGERGPFWSLPGQAHLGEANTATLADDLAEIDAGEG